MSEAGAGVVKVVTIPRARSIGQAAIAAIPQPATTSQAWITASTTTARGPPAPAMEALSLVEEAYRCPNDDDDDEDGSSG
ncbi:unnamed protein product [Nippostrongylus brasiliensis]|uniref:Uncharacterized protein n=1 Tax=Nippostrongylus brasiliensis TaxID=27835 RepID=A0A0N4XTC8_NIPBR|nr:unnamed protein product [Nippostrongylus brasiliensis]